MNKTDSLLWVNISNKSWAPLRSAFLNVVKAPFTYIYMTNFLEWTLVKVIETNFCKKIVNDSRLG